MENKIRLDPTHAQMRDPLLLPVAMAGASAFRRYKRYCKNSYEKKVA